VQKIDPVAQLLPGRRKRQAPEPQPANAGTKCGHRVGGFRLWQRRFGKRDCTQPRNPPRPNCAARLVKNAFLCCFCPISQKLIELRSCQFGCGENPRRLGLAAQISHNDISSRRPADLFRQSLHHARWQAQNCPRPPRCFATRSGKAVVEQSCGPRNAGTLRFASGPGKPPRESAGRRRPRTAVTAEALPAGVEVRAVPPSPCSVSRTASSAAASPTPCSRPATTMAASRGGSASVRICWPTRCQRAFCVSIAPRPVRRLRASSIAGPGGVSMKRKSRGSETPQAMQSSTMEARSLARI
jgi:hypothetical protein